ncbi:response regulator receiver protein [Anopheles sinensis]|uniref:Response regulator receiver protein n=1 Tax=Anopheles sinensis TaxID=74873 RepID=A0A084WE34_ANOSI|nr:response regulator receiver protein [Anopheles sinensis]
MDGYEGLGHTVHPAASFWASLTDAPSSDGSFCRWGGRTDCLEAAERDKVIIIRLGARPRSKSA